MNMKKALAFIVRYRDAIITGFVAGVAYLWAHHGATLERGYEAIGGEIFVPLLIIIGWCIWRSIKSEEDKDDVA